MLERQSLNRVILLYDPMQLIALSMWDRIKASQLIPHSQASVPQKDSQVSSEF